jgi:hypothetical protein
MGFRDIMDVLEQRKILRESKPGTYSPYLSHYN